MRLKWADSIRPRAHWSPRSLSRKIENAGTHWQATMAAAPRKGKSASSYSAFVSLEFCVEVRNPRPIPVHLDPWDDVLRGLEDAITILMTTQIRSNDYVPVLDICRQLYDVLLRRRAPPLRIKNAGTL